MGPVLVIIGSITLIAVLGIPAEAAGVIVGIGVLIGIWYISLLVWPDKRCQSCNGQGSKGPFSLRRRCSPCKGRGRVSRIGAK